MIQAAIRALAEAGGSTAAAIDGHIKSSHRDLPWGHCNLLPYYLRKLAAAGEITNALSGRYSLDDDDLPSAGAAASPSKDQNGTPLRSSSPIAQPRQLAGDDDGGLVSRGLAEEPNIDVPLAVLLPGHRKSATRCEFSHLSFRRLKRKLREGHASPLHGDPVGSPVARRRGRPPKPMAVIVLKDDQKKEAASHGDAGQPCEAKAVSISPVGDPTDSPVVKRRGRTPKRSRTATVLRGKGREVASGHEELPSDQLKSVTSSSNEDPVITKRRGRPPKPKPATILPDAQHEAAAGHEDPQPELKHMVFSTTEDSSPPRSAPVKRRGRPPKRKTEVCHEPGTDQTQVPKKNAMARSSESGEERRDAECCKEGPEAGLPGHGGTSGTTEESTRVAGADAMVASGVELPASTRRGGGRDECAGSRRVTRSESADGWGRPKEGLMGQTVGLRTGNPRQQLRRTRAAARSPSVVEDRLCRGLYE